jgi:cell division protein FtsA
MMQEIKRSGYDGLLPAGLVLTGGSSQLTGIRPLASEVMGLPARVARPENLIGMVDQLHSPAFSTSVGLVQYAMRMKEVDPSAITAPKYLTIPGNPINWGRIKEVLKRFFP